MQGNGNLKRYDVGHMNKMADTSVYIYIYIYIYIKTFEKLLPCNQLDLVSSICDSSPSHFVQLIILL